MALSTPASGTERGGPGPAAEASPRDGAHGHGPLADVVAVDTAPSSLWRDGWRRLRRNKLAMAGGAVVVLLLLIAVFADVLAPYSYTKTNFGRLNEAPSRAYPFGTDQVGRDVLSRMIYGARVSMLVGLGAQVIIVLIGVPIGALSGYIGGRVDILLTRVI